MSKIPNHVCKNCNSIYFACNDCERVNSWKSACCCESCYQEYIKLVLASRSKPVETFVIDEIATKEEFDTEAIEPVEEDTIEE